MNRWRRIVLAAGLAMVLVAGQQVVLLHELDHAADRTARKDTDTRTPCKLHFACSQLASALGGTVPAALPEVRADFAPPLHYALAAGAPPVFAFQSRGPPIG
jgi:hypothetical protein